MPNFWKLFAAFLITSLVYSLPSFSAEKIKLKSSSVYVGKGLQLVGELSLSNKSGKQHVVIRHSHVEE